jgi:hypothetical protein
MPQDPTEDPADNDPTGDDPDQQPPPAVAPPGPPYPGYYPGFAWPPADPRFDPADPLVSADFASWWRRSFAIVRRGWRPLALVQVVTAVPALALLIPAQLYVDLASRDLAAQAAGESMAGLGGFLAASGVSVLAILVASLVYAFGTLAGVRLVVDVALGREARAGRAMRHVLRRLPALIGWSLLGALLAVVAVLACFVPVLYVGAVLTLLPVVVLFEPGGGISRCFQLFNTDLGAAVGRVATIAALGLGTSVVFTVLSVVVPVITQGSAFPDPAAAVSTAAIVANSVTGTLLSGVATIISGVLLTPLIVATYADLRARREPFITAYLPG